MIQKRIVNINEDTFEYSLSGKEGPNIVFISGFRIPMNSWAQLYTSAEELGRVFAYNRLGVGRSSKASAIQTGDVVVNSLRTLLKKLNVLPPYVLVAHSIGGLFANLFARMAPDEISSIVFVDAAHPDEKEKQGEFKPPILLHKVNEGVKSIERMFDKYKYSEDEHVTETVRQIRASGTFPPIPVAVVSGTKKMPFVPEESFRIHLQCQQALLALSPNSRQYVAERSGHFPQITEPGVVLDAIKDVVSTDINSRRE